MRRAQKKVSLLALLSALWLPLAQAQAVNLHAAYQSALSYDADLQSASAARLEAEEGIPVARAGLLPQIAYNRQYNKANTTNYQLGTGRKSNSGNYVTESESLTLRQPLYRKSAWAALESANAQSEAADANYRKEQQNLGLRVAATYFDVLLARTGLDLANAQVKNMEAQVTLSEKALKAGSGTRTDVDEARARRDASRAFVSESMMRLSQVSQDFRTVTNIDPATLPAIDPRSLPEATMAVGNLAEWLTRIESESPDIQSLRKQLEASQAEVERARGGHYPNLDLVAARQNGQSETNTTIGTGYATDYVGVQLTLPLISGFGVMAQVRQTEARVERVRQALESARRKTMAEADRLFLAVAQSIEKVEALKQAVFSAEQALISVQKGARAGTRNIVDELDAITRLTLTKRDQAASVFDLASNRLKFLALANAIDDDAIKYTSAWLASANR